MTVTLQLTAEQERHLKEGAARQDRATVRRVLLQAVETTVETLLDHEAAAQASPDDFEALSRRLVEHFAASAHSEHTPLSADALTRAGIYGDHL